MKKAVVKKESKTATDPVVTKMADNNPAGFPIVGIGASAGGLEALEQFLANTPKNSGMAFVVIQHLDPTHKGIMPELLQRITNMTVLQVTDQLKVKPNMVYVIPPNNSMSILNGYLHLFEPTEIRGLRLPIDIFFRSLAIDQQEKSIGIILSGMGSDGSLGLKAIKEKNGIVLVQNPATSKFNGMPNSAIATVTADIVADANDLPLKLISLLKFNPAIPRGTVVDEKNQSQLDKIIILLRAQTGHDFAFYKKNTLFRRIERRMGIHQIDKMASYVRFLQENPNELDILFKELLIGVTNFFRDVALWDKLKEQILPDLFNQLPNGHIVRVWIAGCSTGEEAYSFAIVFKEAFDKMKESKNLGLQIFATDIDKDAIETARKGVFSSNIVADISAPRLSGFFTSSETEYRVNTSIREMVVFAPHDVIKDPPFTRLDFLLCRNLLIYLEPELQKKLMNLFYYSLKPGGTMILGSAENVNSKENLFSDVDKKLKIYRRAVAPIEIDRMDFPSSLSVPASMKPDSASPSKMAHTLQSFVEQLLLKQFTPPSVLINSEGDILYIIGKTGKYLEPATGKANFNIFAMAREGLGNHLLSAVRTAKQNYKPVILRSIKTGSNGNSRFTDVTIQQTENPAEFRGTIMIVFSDITDIQRHSGKKIKSGAHVPISDEQEIELQRTLEELQSTREEMQTSQEELKSTNEELQSTNEELQSTNEELTTSKEEMQSLNEELQTVNIELQSKVADFMQANSDMKNLLNSTDIATLFLDREFNIRRYTDELTKIIKLRPTDIGRPFTEMVSDLHYPEITEHAREVLRTLIFKESDIATHDHRWYKVRIMPYRTLDDKIEGLVITFIDNTISKKQEDELKKAIEILQKNNLYKP